MSNNQNISAKVRKKIEKFLKKKRKLQSKIKQAREMVDNAKVEKLENKIKTLEEEIKKMIELNKGKLRNVVDATEPVETQVDENEVASLQHNPFDDVVQPQDIPNEQPVEQPMPPGYRQPQYAPPQYAPQYAPLQPQPIIRGQIPPQEIVQQPQAPQPPVDSEVNILLVDSISIKVPLDGRQLQPFLQEIANAIDSQASMQIGSQLINGRNIVVVQF